MKSSWPQNLKIHSTWLRVLVIVLLLLGVFFRFVNLDKKIYWHDEILTSQTISGYTWNEVNQEIVTGNVIGIEDLQKYQQPNSQKSFADSIKSLAKDFPEHPPLYYVMVRSWVEWFGNSVTVTRSLSAWISLLVFPCLYWLCLELFESSLIGWVAIALIAVSPFHVLYAQEAREYCLWTVTILLSSAVLLQAMRLKTKLGWVIYAATVAVMLYTHTFSLLVVIAHGIYVVLTEGLRLSKTVTAYLLASLAGGLTFVPWFLIVVTNLHRVNDSMSWTTEKVSLLSLFSRWLGNLSRIFLDLGVDSSNSLTDILVVLPLILILLIILGYSIYFVYRNTPKRVWLFILALIVVPTVVLMLPDLIEGGRRSGTARYLTPSYLGFHLAVAYLITSQLTYISAQSWRRKLWQIVTIALVSSEIFSCEISSQAELWWNKGSADNRYPLQIAHVINQAHQPLLISDNESSLKVRALSYILKPNIKFIFMVKPQIPKIPNSFSDVFLYAPSQALKSELEKQYKIEPAYEPGNLWRLEKH